MRRTLTLLLLTIAVTGTVSACASTGANTRTSASSRTLITRTEVDASGAASAFDIVNRLRPQWLRGTNIGSIGSGGRRQVLLVYLDDVRMTGGIDALRSINASGVESIRYLDATQAPTVLRDIGTEPVAGAIVVKSKF